VRDLAHLSDGTVIPNPQALAKERRRLRHVKRSIARKQRAADKAHGPRKKGERRTESQRLGRERRRAARLLRRVANLRRDALLEATTTIARFYATAVVEDLRVKNMTRRRKGKGRAAKAGLNTAILDSGMGRLRRLLEYKMPLNGGRLVVVPAAYTSRTCSQCGSINDPGSSKTYECESCGVILDRDRNASLNILAAASWTEARNAHGEVVRPPGSGSAAGLGVRPPGSGSAAGLGEVRIEEVA
jgi:putative transposase